MSAAQHWLLPSRTAPAVLPSLEVPSSSPGAVEVQLEESPSSPRPTFFAHQATAWFNSLAAPRAKSHAQFEC